MNTFLVPTDFSDTARKAADYAAQLAKIFNGRVELLHVYMLPTTVSEIPYLMETADMLQPEFESRAEKEAARIQASFGIPCKWQVQVGLASAEIQFQAEELDVLMIVMGVRDDNERTPFLGSTAVATVKKSSKPILIVPEQADFQSFKTILLATDFSSQIPAKAFDPLVLLLNQFSAQLHLLHVHQQQKDQVHPQDYQEAGITLTPETTDGKMHLIEIFQSFPHEYHEVTDDTIMNGILHFEEQQPADMLVMVARQHGFFQSLFGSSQTRKMVHKTTLPLLVLSAKE